ncbi:DinB family protein [Lysinibacillus sp. Ag94]|uniref:DinB family protein n=1 Tax=Lysinibacillus sp. Ag94 TaxID=2936682 RepID=UPI00200CB590|nr:DinB family protein [Lysinibacillus sp. Ag94]UPW83895.1 hypothetical protein MY533_03190 [Lysinibacillus sp. Ag94]
MKDTLELFRYHVWANKRVFEHLRKLPDDLYRKPLNSVFPTIGDALAKGRFRFVTDRFSPVLSSHF